MFNRGLSVRFASPLVVDIGERDEVEKQPARGRWAPNESFGNVVSTSVVKLSPSPFSSTTSPLAKEHSGTLTYQALASPFVVPPNGAGLADRSSRSTQPDEGQQDFRTHMEQSSVSIFFGRCILSRD